MNAAPEIEEDNLKVPKHLAIRLSGWHSSMWCPCYSVSSRAYEGHPVDRDTFEAALAKMKDCIDSPHHLEHQSEVLEIVAEMESLLGEGDATELIVRSFARTMWTDSWAREAERQCEDTDKSPYPAGSQLDAIAPDTPDSATKAVREYVEEFAKLNSTSLSCIYIQYIYKKSEEAITPSEFGHELAMSAIGYGGDFNFEGDGLKMPYLETDYWEYASEFEADDE